MLNSSHLVIRLSTTLSEQNLAGAPCSMHKMLLLGISPDGVYISNENLVLLLRMKMRNSRQNVLISSSQMVNLVFFPRRTVMASYAIFLLPWLQCVVLLFGKHEEERGGEEECWLVCVCVLCVAVGWGQCYFCLHKIRKSIQTDL